MFESKRFAKEEAEAKIGKRVSSLRKFAEVTHGTLGTVVEVDDMGRGEWDVVIEWDTKPPRSPLILETVEFTYMRSGKPRRDWYTKTEYETCLREVDTTTN
jgi:hypothetical protein